jgi:replicative DNA helicase
MDNLNILVPGLNAGVTFNPEYEQAVLGALITGTVEDATGVEPDMFAVPGHQRVFEALRADVRPTELTVTTYLSNKNMLAIAGGKEGIRTICRNAAKAPEHGLYCDKLRELALSRAIKAKCDETALEITSGACTGQDALRVLQECITASTRYIATDNRFDTDQLLDQAFSDTDEGKASPVITGFDEIDALLVHCPGEIHAIAAASRTGKTTFALSVIVRQAQAGVRTALFCTETPGTVLALKAACILAKVDYSDYKAGRMTATDTAKLQEAQSQLSSMKHLIHFRGQGQFIRTPAGINDEVLNIERKYGKLHALHVDYLQALEIPKGVRPDDYSARNNVNVERLADIVARRQIACTLYCQITRAAQSNQRPLLHQLKYAGQLENSAHIVSFLWDYNQANGRKAKSGQPVDIRFYSDKNRDDSDFSLTLQRCSGGPVFRVKPSKN